MQDDSISNASNVGRHSFRNRPQSFSDVNWLTPPNDTFPYNEVYKPLDIHRPEIRLMRLRANQRDTPIECQLIDNVSLPLPGALPSRIMQYNALSYCAGNPKDYQSLSVNGHKFHVFASLLTALNQWRLSFSDRLIWVDQICINLRDETERGLQVLRMKDIYKSATSVQIWLGGASKEPCSDLAFEFMTEFLNTNVEYVQISPHRRPCGNSASEDIHMQFQRPGTDQDVSRALQDTTSEFEPHNADLDRAIRWLRDRLHDPAYETIWAATLNILSRPVWRRCWVIQEIVTSTTAKILCGSRSIKWEPFMAFIYALWKAIPAEDPTATFSERRSSLGKRILDPILLDTLRRRDREPSNSSMSLFALLCCFRSWQAWDPRDKIFSLLGLLNAEQLQAYRITRDYSQDNTVAEVLVKTAKAIITTEKNIDILGSVIGDESSRGLPTWTPDWTRPVVSTTQHLVDFWISNLKFKNKLSEVTFLEDDRVVKMSVWVFDIIHFEAESTNYSDHKNSKESNLVENAMDPQLCYTNHNHVALTGGIQALVPTTVKPNDRICIPLGAQMAYVVRPSGKSYILIGKAHLWDCTGGKAFEEYKKRGDSIVQISLH